MQRQFLDAKQHQEQQQQQEQLLYGASISSRPPYPTQNPLENMNYIHPHFMPEPSSEPWNINSMPWKSTGAINEDDDNVMQFHAKYENDRRLQLHQKRKSDILPEHQPKQFITEEKFTAHFNGLHISSDYVQQPNQTFNNIELDEQPSTSGVCFTNRTYEDYRSTARELEEKLMKANRITICDEVKKLYEEQKKVSLLPEMLLNRQEKPCKALVLWQPSPLSIIQNSPALSDLLEQNANNDKTLSSYDKIKNKDNKDNDNDNSTKATHSKMLSDNLDDYEEFNSDVQDVEIDDFIDNNNTSSLDFNNFRQDGMDEDL